MLYLFLGFLILGHSFINALDAVGDPSINRAQLLSTKSCPQCNLTYVDLTKAQLEGAMIDGAMLESASLENANFKKASAIGASFRSSDADRAQFNSANLTKASFFIANANYANFEWAILKGVNFSGQDASEPATFTFANFDNTDLTNDPDRRTNFYCTNLQNATIRRAKAAGITFVQCNCSRTSWENTDLRSTQFLQRTDLTNANFKDAITDSTTVFLPAVGVTNIIRNTTMPDGTVCDMGSGNPEDIKKLRQCVAEHSVRK